MSGSDRIDWWIDARFGMFIHWGLYTIDGLDCWKMADMGIPVDEYVDRYEKRFNPLEFDAGCLAEAARDAGCKYVVMGTRHHEGYCLWNTKTTDFSSVSMTPKRDFIAEYADAVRSVGLRVGFYYSLLDWRYRSYWHGPRKNPEGWRDLVDCVHRQVRELMTQYGRIDILWYDGAWQAHGNPGWGFAATGEELARYWRSDELYSMVKELQPEILINNRSYLPGDFGTPEQTITPEDRPWELCDTMGDLWGAADQDLNRKTVREILTRLITCVSLGGNMLLNIGPDENGRIQEWQRDILMKIGRWLDIHGEAIYGAEGEWAKPFNNGLAAWRTTRKGNTLYLHLLRYPGREFGVANLHDYWFVSAELMGTGESLKIEHEATRDIIHGLPEASADDLISVVKITIRAKTDAEKQNRRHIGAL
jgi:alpha-L-fucosidase